MSELVIKALEVIDEVIDLYLETKNPNIVPAFEPELMFSDINFSPEDLSEIIDEYQGGATELMYASNALGNIKYIAPEISPDEHKQIIGAYGHMTDEQLTGLYMLYAKVLVAAEEALLAK